MPAFEVDGRADAYSSAVRPRGAERESDVEAYGKNVLSQSRTVGPPDDEGVEAAGPLGDGVELGGPNLQGVGLDSVAVQDDGPAGSVRLEDQRAAAGRADRTGVPEANDVARERDAAP